MNKYIGPKPVTSEEWDKQLKTNMNNPQTVEEIIDKLSTHCLH